jgi:hypothetical protein
MKLVRLFVLVSALLLVMSLLAACGGGSAAEVPTAESQQENVQEPAPTGENAQTTESVTQSPEAEQTKAPAMPEDVPIMENHRDFQATSDFTNISFIVDLEISEVVAWYQAELLNYGWELSRAPDSALGAMANMSRINVDNDRLTISLQHNPMGEFTVVRIVVVRSP